MVSARFPPDALHPIVRTHPVTERKCLFVCDGYSYRVEGLSEPEGKALLEELFEHIARPQFHYAHRWRLGDLLIWDNCAVQHLAIHDYEWPRHRRMMHRVTVGGSTTY